MSTPDTKNSVARAQFGDLGPNAAGAGGQEMNLNLILGVAVTLALEVGRARMPVRDLLQLAPGAVVELDRLAPMTARTTEQTPEIAAPGVEMADSSSATNRLLYRVPPAALEKTVLVKEPEKPQPNEQPKTE
jgi:hypothetical protein